MRLLAEAHRGGDPEIDLCSFHPRQHTSITRTENPQALKTALTEIEKAYGKGAIMRLDEKVTPDVDVISTGSLGVDLALGIGGLPRGRVVEIYGPESSGKTTLALHVLAEAQKAGGVCAFIDAEHALRSSSGRPDRRPSHRRPRRASLGHR